MTIVPVITLLIGYFPIALNLPTVVAITAYYISLHALTFYSKALRELRALWLANIGTSILFWPYLKAALFTPWKQISGKGLAFKSTSKGAPPPPPARALQRLRACVAVCSCACHCFVDRHLMLHRAVVTYPVDDSVSQVQAPAGRR
jgi:hypothetical protein